ncbi:MAG: HlyD family secretion protein [Bdellovibrionales bacterium]|nr:HlyD family secretion protein [Bdellovibrionales bacterium]
MSTSMTDTAATNVKTEAAPVSKKKKILTGLAAVAVVGLLYFTYEEIFFVSTDNAQIRGNATLLSAKVNGFITKVNVEENQKVKAGEVLAVIDAKDYDAKSSAATNEMEGLAARAKDAQTNAKRVKELFAAGAVTRQQLDSATASATELENRLEALKSQVELSQYAVNDTQVRAPSDGVIARRSAEVGMLASPGIPLFGFVSSESRWVVANFKETDLKKLKIGAEAEISVDAIGGRKFHGVVESLSPATGSTFSLIPQDNATGNFTKVVQRVPVRIRLEGLNAEDIDALKSGLSADVKVHAK